MSTDFLLDRVLVGWRLHLQWTPHRWAKFPRPISPALAAQIPLDQYQMTTVPADDDLVDVYLKYIGPALEGGPRNSSTVRDEDFQDPPTPRRPPRHMSKTLAAARNYPGQWFVIRDMHTAAASLITHGKAYGALPGEFMAVSRFNKGSLTKDELANGKTPVCNLYVQCLDQKGDAIPLDDPHTLALEQEDPPNAHKIKNKARPSGLNGRRSPVTVWLDKIVRPAAGEWRTYPGVFPPRANSHVANGSMYGAQPGEFDVKVEKAYGTSGTTSKVLKVRVNQKWLDDAPLREAAQKAEAERKSKGEELEWVTPEVIKARLEQKELLEQAKQIRKIAREGQKRNLAPTVAATDLVTQTDDVPRWTAPIEDETQDG